MSTKTTLLDVVSSCRRVRRVCAGMLVAPFIVVAASTACVTTQGQTVVQRPPLDVPPAPPRVIAPLPVPEPPPVEEPPAEDPTGGKPLPPPKPKPPANTKPAETKPPETPVVDPIPAPVTPPPVPPPTPTLSTPTSGDAGAVSKQIRDSIDRTRKTLDGIDYRPLSNARKKAYDDSKLFATQADDALKANNLVFAKELADKAERLAKELQGR